MVGRTVGSPPQTHHILHLQANSALVEGFVSVIFDLLLLATAEMLIHNICSTHNLRIVYDNGAALYLRARSRSALELILPEVGVGPAWLSRVLSILLFVLSSAAVLLGFAINGVSENELSPAVYRTVASIPFPPNPVTFDYRREYRVAANQTPKDKPHRLSRRLVALDIVDQCQVCHYDRCEYIAYAFPIELIDTTLVVAERERESFNVTCVTKAAFRDSVVNWNPARWRKTPRRECLIERVRVPTSLRDDEPADGVPEVKRCDLTLVATRCYRRPGSPVHCAIAGQYRDQQRLNVIVVKDADDPGSKGNFEMAFFEMSGVAQLSREQLCQYLDNVAFMAALKLAPAYKLDLMAFVTLTHDVPLERRDRAKTINVSEIDLRLAVPCVVILVLSVILLGVGAVQGWVMAVYYKRRHRFNSFTTVPDLLELLLESGLHLNRSRQEASFSPVVGIRRDEPRIGVQVPGEEFVGGAAIDESEIL